MKYFPYQLKILINLLLLCIFILILKNYIDQHYSFTKIDQQYSQSELSDVLRKYLQDGHYFFLDNPKYRFSKFISSIKVKLFIISITQGNISWIDNNSFDWNNKFNYWKLIFTMARDTIGSIPYI